MNATGCAALAMKGTGDFVTTASTKAAVALILFSL
jgi:hypothetical protein